MQWCVCGSVVNLYEKSYGSSSLRSCYWAVESAKFVKALMTTLVEEDELPSDLDAHGWLFLDVERCAISDFKRQTLIASFHDDGHLSESAALYDEDLSPLPVFFLTVVKNVITLPGVRDDLSFVRSVFSLPSRHFIAEDAPLERCGILRFSLWR